MATDSKIKSSTVDPTETQLFSSLSREWWNIDGLMKPMHGINQLVVPYIKEVLSKKFGEDESQTTFLKDIQVLEVGCGGKMILKVSNDFIDLLNLMCRWNSSRTIGKNWMLCCWYRCQCRSY